jgi:hypothetical protein
VNISLSFTILGPGPRSHLPAEEENHPNQEGAAHNQWRSQCCQILEHAGLLSPPEFALLVSLPGIVTHPSGRLEPGPLTRPWPHITDLRHDHVRLCLIPVTKIHDMPGPGMSRARRAGHGARRGANRPPCVTTA